jgi:hypothetical protein
MESPFGIILEMVRLVFGNTLQTLGGLVNLFGSLTQSLAFISSMGILGFFLAATVLAVVLYFLGKFFLGSWKILLGLFLVGIVLIWVLIAA